MAERAENTLRRWRNIRPNLWELRVEHGSFVHRTRTRTSRQQPHRPVPCGEKSALSLQEAWDTSRLWDFAGLRRDLSKPDRADPAERNLFENGDHALGAICCNGDLAASHGLLPADLRSVFSWSGHRCILRIHRCLGVGTLPFSR